MAVIFDLSVGDLREKIILLFLKSLNGILSLPLEGSKGLGHEASTADCDLRRLALGSVGVVIECLYHLFRKVGDSVKVLVRLGGKSHHKVELDHILARVKCHVHRAEKVFLKYVLIYNVAKSLCTRLGGKGQRRGADRLDLIHKLLCKAVNSEGGQRQIYHILIRPIDKSLGKLGKSRIVADGKRGKGYFLKARVLIKALSLTAEHLGCLFTDGAVDHSRLTEAASAHASAVDLQHYSLLNRLDVGDDHILGEEGFIEILHYRLCHLCGHVLIDGGICLYRSVFVVGNVIERRDVDSLPQLCRLVEECLSCVCSLVLHLYVEPCERHKGFLALSDRKAIEEVSHRLGVIGAGAAADDDRVVLPSVRCAEGYICKLQHIQNICVAHLVLKSEADYVKFGKGVAALVCGERKPVLSHPLLHICPRSVGSLAPDIALAIEHSVKYLHTEIGKSYLVGIGKAKCPSCLHACLVFYDLSELAAGVSSRL